MASILTSFLAQAQLQLDILVGHVQWQQMSNVCQQQTDGTKHHVRNVWVARTCINHHATHLFPTPITQGNRSVGGRHFTVNQLHKN